MHWAFRLGEAPRPQPWGDWLPPVAQGVVTAWLRANVPPGAWVADPFGAAPEVTVEAAQAGYRVLAVVSNPVLAFLLRAAAAPLAREDLQATLAALAAAPKGDQRLEPYLRSLYTAPCPRCGAPAEVRVCRHRREGVAFERQVYCPRCEALWSAPADATEERFEATLGRRAPMHRARLAERVAPLGSPQRPAVDHALRLLPPRSLEALTALLARRSDPNLAPHQPHLDALLLLAIEAAFPRDDQGRPLRRPALPAHYREVNLWHAIEAGLDLWAPSRPAVPLVSAAQPLPGFSGIRLFEGKVRQAASAFAQTEPQAVVAVVPRPQPSFWLLSALATAWLWGREALGPLGKLLDHRRTDWGWYTAALEAALRPLARFLAPDTPFLALLPQADAALLTAFVVAAHRSGWTVESVAPQTHPPEVQMVLRRGERPPDNPAQTLTEAVETRNAPTPYLVALAAALQGYAPDTAAAPQAAYAQARHDLNRLFAEAEVQPARAEAPQETPWLPRRQPPGASPPLSDRVEEALVKLLAETPAWEERALINALYARFPDVLTPAGDEVEALLAHYAQRDAEGKWRLREAERPQARAADLAEIRGLIRRLGERLGYTVRGDLPLRWEEEGREVARFYPAALARTAPLLQSPPPGEAYLVLPGSRAPLWRAKVAQDPRLQQALAGPWRVLKFRHLRRLAREVHRREDWLRLRDLDPMEHQDAQLPLL